MEQYNILVIDDSPFIRSLVKNLLKPLDPIIEEASNGKEGLDKALEKSYDLIITDIEMPKKDGVELCIELKTIKKTETIPVVMLSGFDSELDVSKGFQAGASAYISKKEARTHLLKTVSNLLVKTDLKKQQLIMVVDDSLALLELVSDGLLRTGFKIIKAENGKIALDLLKKNRPNLILSDINMPVMNGLEFLEEVQRDEKLNEIPFVVMSTMDDKAHIKNMIQRGAVAYLVKPFNLDELITLIEKLLTDQFLLLLKEKERLDLESNMMLASITSLVSALEARDHYTKGHSEAVARMLSTMVDLSGGSEEDIRTAYIGGQLHDIGKIGVPDSVLLKPGKLTFEEFDIIKQHPVTGSTILQPIPSLKKIVSVVYYHHERMDANGYPDKIKGSNIPLWARFTSVADTYHALTSNRPYRKGMSKDKALQIIDEVKGTQLFPDCVKLFLQMLNLHPKW